MMFNQKSAEDFDVVSAKWEAQKDWGFAVKSSENAKRFNSHRKAIKPLGSSVDSEILESQKVGQVAVK